MEKKFILSGVLTVFFTLTAVTLWAQQGVQAVSSARINELDIMVISADRIPEPARQVSQNVTVITEEEIQKSAANDLADLLKQKGLQVFHDGAAGYGNEGIVVRGGRSSMHGFDIAGDILVLVDGHRSGADSLSQMELGNTARIEIIRGPGAVQYGAAAMGGVVNIITKRGGEKTEARLEAGFGTRGEQRSKGSLAGQIGQFDYSVGGSFFTRDDYKVGGGEKYENSGLRYRTRYNANLGWNFDDNNRVGLIAMGSDTRGAGKGPDGSSTRRYDTRQNRNNYNLDFAYEGRSEDQSKSWLARYFRGEVGYDLSRRLNGLGTPRVPLSYNTNEYQGAQGQFSWDLGRFQFVTGVDWMSYEFDQNQTGEAASNNTRNSAQSEFDNTGAFFLGKVHLLDDHSLTLSGGLRYDEFDVSVDSYRLRTGNTERKKTSQSRDTWTPSLGLAYSPLEYLKLRANYAQAFKMPLPRQLTGFTIMMTIPFIGNPDLQPEESDNWDVGFDLEYEALSFSATYFHSKYKNMINYGYRNDRVHYPTTYYWYYNQNRATINGLEIGASFDLGEHFDLGFRLAPYAYWTHLLKFEDDGGWKLPNRARNSLSYGVKFDHPDIGLTVNLDATYYGAQYDVQRVTSGANYGQILYDYRVPDVGRTTVWDLNLSKRLYQTDEYGDLSVKVALKNIFDKKYSTNEDQWMPGSSAYVGLVWTY